MKRDDDLRRRMKDLERAAKEQAAREQQRRLREILRRGK